MKRRRSGGGEASEEARRGKGNTVEVNLLVELFLYLLALVPSEDAQQPFLRWRKKVWRGNARRGRASSSLAAPAPAPGLPWYHP